MMHDVQLDDQQYARYRMLVQDHCGLAYPAQKRADLTRALLLTCRDTGVTNLDLLYAHLAEGSPVWDTLIMHLTIGETYFFRNQPQFMALRRSILPDLMSRRAMSRQLRLWSAGCATGEEPYSIAIALSEVFRNHEGWQASILATDINPAFLARAQAAVYGAWSFRDTPDTLRDTYFQPEQNRWRLRPEIRHMVRFTRLNLAEPSYPSVTNGTGAMDVIFCRNVTIYFDEATTRAVVQRLYQALTPGGWLIVGHAEPQARMYRDFDVHNFPDTVAYRKPLTVPMFVAGPPDPQPPVIREIVNLPRSLPPSAAPDSGADRTALNPSHTDQPQRATPAPAHAPPLPTVALIPLRDLLNQAQLEADQGRWPTAEAFCERILARDPLLVQAHYLLAQIREHQGDLDGALAGYRRTIYLDRSFVMGALGMGNIWRQKGRISDAQRSYRNVLDQLAQQPMTGHPAGAEHLSNAELTEVVKHLLQSMR